MKLSIKTALCVVGAVLETVAAAGNYRNDVHVLMYETDGSLEGQWNSPLHFFRERSEVANLKTTIYGSNLEYRGFGDKYSQLRPLLEIMNDDTLVILADARDVALNVPKDEDMATAAVDHFVEHFKTATENSPNAVVLSAEAQCCVSAMSHAHPSEYFDLETGKRNKRACSSGHADCYWSENDNIRSWVGFMHERAFEKTGLEDADDVYLNAGLMAGYPEDLLRLLDVMDINPEEDDQAVLTGLMYTYPDMIVLDYGQEMFGNNQWTRGPEDGCVFEGFGPDSSLVQIDTQTQPLMIHTPGKFYACLDILIEALGGVSQQRYHPTTRKLLTGRLSLAAQLGFGGAASDADRDSGSTRGAIQPVEPEPVEPEATEAPTEKETVPTNYGNYGQYGSASNYGNSGNYGVIGRNYGLPHEIYDTTPDSSEAVSNYGNYGQYGSYSNYGNYGQYGTTSNYGQYGSRVRRRRRISTTDA